MTLEKNHLGCLFFYITVLCPMKHECRLSFITIFFRFLKLPSRRPSLVCENCLYSKKMDRRARAFHIMDPQGVLEMLIVFLEERGVENLTHPVLDNSQVIRFVIDFYHIKHQSVMSSFCCRMMEKGLLHFSVLGKVVR